MKSNKSYTPQHYQKNKSSKSSDYAAKILWKHIGNRQLHFTFRKEHHVNKYVVDFYSVTLKLAIEIVENNFKPTERDVKRENNLAQVGVKILRFKDSEVRNNINSVIAKIEKYIDENRPINSEEDSWN